MEMLAHPTFKNFRLISDRSGLNNPIRNAAILDWETGKAVDDSFFPGDFVVTSLAAFKDDPELANSTLASLIEKNITGLAINDICFSDVSDNILALANACHIPVFMFSGTNMTEIIYALKNEMTFTGRIDLSRHSRDWQAEVLRQVQLVVRRLPASDRFNKLINNIKKSGNK